ncbi:MAG: hypothetical protein ABI180_06080 [Microcoleus sp.]
MNYRGFAIALQSLGSEKPGFCDNLQLSTRDIERNPVSEIIVPPKSRSGA